MRLYSMYNGKTKFSFGKILTVAFIFSVLEKLLEYITTLICLLNLESLPLVDVNWNNRREFGSKVQGCQPEVKNFLYNRKTVALVLQPDRRVHQFLQERNGKDAH